MLYPKEDEDSHKLQFTCRTCQYTEEATSTCVFRNVLNNAAGETAGVTQDVGSDPTVGIPSTKSPVDAPGRPVFCLLCNRLVMCMVCRREPVLVQLGDPCVTVRVAESDSPSSSTDSSDMSIHFDFGQFSEPYDFEDEMEYGNGEECETEVSAETA